MKIKIAGVLLLSACLMCKNSNADYVLRFNGQNQKDVLNNPLAIPPLLAFASKKGNHVVYKLVVRKGTSEFFKGARVTTYGYNGPLLGPTVRVRRGQNVTVTVKNNLQEYTTVHWHGMLVPGNVDGGPRQTIPPGGTWKAAFTVQQPAATAWYHPHGVGTTAVQVYKGLAGMFLIEDAHSSKLAIPNKYGINDIPLIVQDKRFTSDGYPVYLTSMRDVVEGMKGNVVLVNGVVKPYLNVSATLYRFRLLNGSNARVFSFRLMNDAVFYQIATDAGFLARPVPLRVLRLSPGERAEIIIDFSKYERGKDVYLLSRQFKILKFTVSGKKSGNTFLPKSLVNLKFNAPENVKNRRYFELMGMGHHVAINNRQFNINRIDEYGKQNELELWKVSSSTRMMMMHARGDVYHNFHVHGAHFQILDRDGSLPPENERGWKDTVLLDRNETVSLLIRFYYKGIFMYHCHVLEHEDNGMMGQIAIE